MQFTRFQGVTFEIAVYSFTLAKLFPKSFKNASQNPLNCPKMLPKTFQIERKCSFCDENEKSEKKRGRSQWLPRFSATFWWFLDPFCPPKWRPNPFFSYVKKQDDFNQHSFEFFDVSGVVFGVFFGTLESSKSSISSRRNTNFFILGLPKSR